jgi:predicted ABC-type ATPase
MKRNISDKAFDELSKEKQKQYVAQLIIQDSGAQPVTEPTPPIAIIMAGLPGAGKTEFLDTIADTVLTRFKFEPFVRIDLDQIITVYPGYTPERYAKFRSQANYALARCIDTAKTGRYNMMIDGTFAGKSESSINNIKRLLDCGYVVALYYMHDNALTAWEYTKSRELETKRGIEKEGFLNACKNISTNLDTAIQKFSDNKSFMMSVVVQKKLRDKDYQIVSDQKDIDNIIKEGYNIDKLVELL